MEIRQVEIKGKELKQVNGSSTYEIWATGKVASCDYAGMIFVYGAYGLACLTPIGFGAHMWLDAFLQN